MMNRRSFLVAAAAGAFAPATLVRAAEGKRRVVVVGGGLAGLSCAYKLRKRGFEAIVLEGQGRAGGRAGSAIAGRRDRLSPESLSASIPCGHGMCATSLLTAAASEACPRTNATGAHIADRYRSGLWIFQSCAHVKTLPPDDWANADRLPTQSLAPLRQAETFPRRF